MILGLGGVAASAYAHGVTPLIRAGYTRAAHQRQIQRLVALGLSKREAKARRDGTTLASLRQRHRAESARYRHKWGGHLRPGSSGWLRRETAKLAAKMGVEE